MSNRPTGAVFTPKRWAKWLLDQADAPRRWVEEATVGDPTAGNGAFIYALVDSAVSLDLEIDEKMLSRLYLIEREARFISEFESGFKLKYQRDFPKGNLILADVVLSNPKRRFDLLVRNPPWVNFCDLPTQYKEATKSHFLGNGLVPDSQAVLLGSSRVDFAALIIMAVLNDNLVGHGDAVFFLPLSLFFGDGAHSGFRRYRLKAAPFRVRGVWDFRSHPVFPDVSTRVGAAMFRRDEESAFPVPYNCFGGETWTSHYAAPVGEPAAPLSVFAESADFDDLLTAPQILVRADQKPRQGVNTCGANSTFIFDRIPEDLPEQFIFPLLSKECFRDSATLPRKFILLPYDTATGNPLARGTLSRFPALWSYLEAHREMLENRKGSLLGAWIKRGIWWACLGVGKYNFTPCKVVWEAYGKDTFAPRVFSTFGEKPWQANQAMHCYIPCSTGQEADTLLGRLQSSHIERYLKSLNIEGTCNWAQPGGIKRFLKFGDPEPKSDRQLQLV
jgi:hypothetical protein